MARLRSTKDGPRLFRYPVRQIEQLWARTHQGQDRPLAPAENPLAGIDHDLLDIDLEIELLGAREVKLNLRGEEIVYDSTAQKLKAFGTMAPLPKQEGSVRLRVLLDRASIELFGNNGQADLSKVFYPEPTNRAVSLTVTGTPARIRRLAVRELRSVYK